MVFTNCSGTCTPKSRKALEDIATVWSRGKYPRNMETRFTVLGPGYSYIVSNCHCYAIVLEEVGCVLWSALGTLSWSSNPRHNTGILKRQWTTEKI